MVRRLRSCVAKRPERQMLRRLGSEGRPSPSLFLAWGFWEGNRRAWHLPWAALHRSFLPSAGRGVRLSSGDLPSGPALEAGSDGNLGCRCLRRPADGHPVVPAIAISIACSHVPVLPSELGGSGPSRVSQLLMLREDRDARPALGSYSARGGARPPPCALAQSGEAPMRGLQIATLPIATIAIARRRVGPVSARDASLLRHRRLARHQGSARRLSDSLSLQSRVLGG